MFADDDDDGFGDFPLLRPMLKWDELAEGLGKNNRFVPPDGDYVERLVASALQCATELPAGTRLYRARIHPKEKELETEPLPWSEVGMAPRGLVRGARLNPDRISCLYCSFAPETAVAEVRPWLGARVSIGCYVSKVGLRVVDLRQEAADRLGDIHLMAVAHMIGRPVGFDDRESYLPSQFLSEQLKAREVFGVRFDSSLSPGGSNIALYSEFGLRKASLELRQVVSVDVSTSIMRLAADD